MNLGWVQRWGSGHRGSLTVSPAIMSKESGWFQGTADAIYQNFALINSLAPSEVNVFGGDHVYLMDVRQFNGFHKSRAADMTISTIPVLRSKAAGEYGVLEVDSNGRVIDFQEKPKDPAPMPGNPDYCLTSMGNYVFDSSSLLEELLIDSAKKKLSKIDPSFDSLRHTTHDFGYDVIPSMLRSGKGVFAYDFSTNSVPGLTESERGYWRDIGGIDSFFDANMELASITPPINLYNPEWPILSDVHSSFQPVKNNGSDCQYSVIAQGCILTDSRVRDSILGYGVKVEKADLGRAIIMGSTLIGEGSILRNCIVDRNNYIPPGTRIGVDPQEDVSRGFNVTDGGIVAVPSNYRFD